MVKIANKAVIKRYGDRLEKLKTAARKTPLESLQTTQEITGNNLFASRDLAESKM